MADVTVKVIDQQVVLTPFGADALMPLVSLTSGYKDVAVASAIAAASSAAAAQAGLDRYYATIAAGVAATTTGQYFASPESGITRLYLRTGTTPFYTDLGPIIRALPTFETVRDGTTDNKTTLAAIASTLSANDTDVARLRQGVTLATDAFALPDGIGLLGEGGDSRNNSGTVLKAGNAAFQVAVGGRGSANASFGPPVGQITIDGNGTATTPLYFGRTLQRFYPDLVVRNAGTGAAILIEEMQNNTGVSWSIMGGLGLGIVFDRGAGGNLISRLEVNDTVGASVTFKETSGTGPYAVPTYNRIDHGLFERAVNGQAADLQAGTDNFLLTPIFASIPSTISAPVNLVEVSGGTRWRFWGASFIGTVSWTTGLAVAANVEVRLLDTARFNSLAVGVSLAVGASLDYDTIAASAVTTMFSGAGAENTYARKRIQAKLFLQRWQSTDTAIAIQAQGDANDRWRFAVDANTGISLGNGTSAPDANFARIGPGIVGNSTFIQSNTLLVGTVSTKRKITSVSALPTSGSYTQGDILFNALCSAGGSPGWVCTTTGIAGSTAVFKAMPAVAA